MKSRLSTLQTVTVGIAFIALMWFLWPQLATIAFTALMAYMFYPLFLMLKPKTGRFTVYITLIISLMVVLIPIAIITFAAAGQLVNFINSASSAETWQHLPDAAQQALLAINTALQPLTGKASTFTEQDVLAFTQNTLPDIARAAIGTLLGVLSNLPQACLAILIYIFVFIELQVKGPLVIKKLKELSPYDTKTTSYYLRRIGLMSGAMVRGQLLIAVIISTISAILLLPLGYANYFFIILVLCTILNFIPLGSGLLTIPLCIIAMVSGQFWLGLITMVLLYAAGWLDVFLRPKFVPDEINFSTALVVLSVFCGVAYFGIFGVIYGPIVLMLIQTVFELHISAKKKLPASSR